MSKQQSSIPDPLDQIIAFIQEAFDDFAIDERIDRKFFALLTQDFDTIDVLDELKNYHAWTLDQPRNGRAINHHSRFRHWLKRALLMRSGNRPN